MSQQCDFDLSGKGNAVPLTAYGTDARTKGITPGVILINPLYPRNVAGVLRACSAWGARQLWWTGDRVKVEMEKGERLPREERMRGYRNVEMHNSDRPFDFYDRDVVPVCIELRPGSEQLQHFEHPEKVVYVFGPEDGSVYKPILHLCHRFVVIPTHHCLNLSAAVNVILAHRRFQRISNGLEEDLPADQWLAENRGPMFSMTEEG